MNVRRDLELLAVVTVQNVLKIALNVQNLNPVLTPLIIELLALNVLPYMELLALIIVKNA